MKQALQKQSIGFTQIKNEVLNDKDLSWKAKGLYCYIYSKPETWQFSAKRIAMDSSNKLTSTTSAIKELEDNGYLQGVKQADGRMSCCLN